MVQVAQIGGRCNSGNARKKKKFLSGGLHLDIASSCVQKVLFLFCCLGFVLFVESSRMEKCPGSDLECSEARAAR